MEDKYNIKQMIIFILIIVITLGIFYGITILVTKNKKTTTDDTTQKTSEEDISIDYDTILVQNIFNQSQESYYVLASFNDDENLSTYTDSIQTYKDKENSLKVYEIDLDSAFNKNYVSNTSDFESEYPIFSETTFLKIENGKITETYTGKSDITTILSVLTEE